LGDLLDTIEEGDVKMTASLQDKMIAYKGQSGRKLISNIEHTKVGKGRKGKRPRQDDEGGVASATLTPMFPQRNKSPLDSMQPAKRTKQRHPGNSKHIAWSNLHLCQFCNHGVQSKVLQCICAFES
jgi:hypothetical protein